MSNWARLGVQYLTWNGAYYAWSTRWQPCPMADRGSAPQNHDDHVNVNVWPGDTGNGLGQLEAWTSAVCAALAGPLPDPAEMPPTHPPVEDWEELVRAAGPTRRSVRPTPVRAGHTRRVDYHDNPAGRLKTLLEGLLEQPGEPVGTALARVLGQEGQGTNAVVLERLGPLLGLPAEVLRALETLEEPPSGRWPSGSSTW